MRFFSANVDCHPGGEMKTHRAHGPPGHHGGSRCFAKLRPAPAQPPLQHQLHALGQPPRGGPSAEIVAAILACSWSYAEIGRTSGRTAGARAGTPFTVRWVQGYSSEEYQETNRALVERMDAPWQQGALRSEYRLRRSLWREPV